MVQEARQLGAGAFEQLRTIRAAPVRSDCRAHGKANVIEGLEQIRVSSRGSTAAVALLVGGQRFAARGIRLQRRTP